MKQGNIKIDDCIEFGNWLRQERSKRANVTMKMLEEVTGVSDSYINHLENYYYKSARKDLIERVLDGLAQFPVFEPELTGEVTEIWEEKKAKYPEINNRGGNSATA